MLAETAIRVDKSQRGWWRLIWKCDYGEVLRLAHQWTGGPVILESNSADCIVELQKPRCR
uniref:Uncharacterized protein n=1 Tax=Arundo donax TaxID=35708 RepID=A0A0A9H9F3_ARUDO